jgi:pilus assembly protein CpaB
MKATVIILVLLGLAAAISAMFLVGALHADSSDSAEGNPSGEVEAIIVENSLPAMTVISSKHVMKKTIMEEELPEGYIASSAQAVGRILSVPVVEGQVLTRSCLVTTGTGALLAAAIPPGKRAVSVTLSANDITGGMLYPGCIVDIIASFRLKSSNRSRGQALSTTLLNGIQVLAVGDTSVVSGNGLEEENGLTQKTNGNKTRLTVTLMVEPRQAEALQLAINNGKIFLAMRNPLDKELVDVDATVLSQGRLAKLGSLLAPVVLTNEQKKNALIDKMGLENVTDTLAPPDTNSQPNGLDALFGSEGFGAQPPSRWGVTVIWGSEIIQQELDIPKSDVFSLEEN